MAWDDPLDIKLQFRQVMASLKVLSAKVDFLTSLTKQEMTRMSAMEDAVVKLTADVTAQSTVIDSAETLLKGLHDQLAAAVTANASGDPAPLAALSAALQAKTAELAAAVAANAAPAAP